MCQPTGTQVQNAPIPGAPPIPGVTGTSTTVANPAVGSTLQQSLNTANSGINGMQKTGQAMQPKGNGGASIQAQSSPQWTPLQLTMLSKMLSGGGQ